MVGHTFVVRRSMFMVIRQPLARKREFFRWLYRVRVVIAQNPRPVPIMQSQAVAHARRHEGGRNNFPRIYLDPVAALLLKNPFVEFEKSGQAFVGH